MRQSAQNSNFLLFIEFFNKIVKSQYTTKVKKVKSQYSARIKEGWTLDKIVIAINGASQDAFLMGRHPNNSRRYLTPEYILRADKLENWYNEGLRQMRLLRLREEEKQRNLQRQKDMEEFQKNGNKLFSTQLQEMRNQLQLKFNLKK